MDEKELAALAAKYNISVLELKALLARGQKQTGDLKTRLAKLEAFMGKSLKRDSKYKTVNDTKEKADAHNKKVLDYKEHTKEQSNRVNLRAKSREQLQINDITRAIHSGTDKAARIGVPIMFGAAALGAAPAYSAVSSQIPSALNYLSNGWRLWNALNPVSSMLLNATGTGLALGAMADPQTGVQKTINATKEGRYGDAILSGMGDAWNGYVAANGLYNFGNQFGSMMSQAWEPLPSLNPFVKKTTTVTTRAPYRVNVNKTVVDKAALDLATALYQLEVAEITNAFKNRLYNSVEEIQLARLEFELALQNAFNKYKAIPGIKEVAAGSTRPTYTTTNTSYGLSFGLPYAGEPYGIPAMLPESATPGAPVIGRSLTYAPPIMQTGLNGPYGQWRATTLPASVRTNSIPVTGGFNTHATQNVAAPAALPYGSTLMPVPGLPVPPVAPVPDGYWFPPLLPTPYITEPLKWSIQLSWGSPEFLRYFRSLPDSLKVYGNGSMVNVLHSGDNLPTVRSAGYGVWDPSAEGAYITTDPVPPYTIDASDKQPWNELIYKGNKKIE